MNKWMKDGIYTLAIGDALGCPVQFESREEVRRHPVTDMRGYGTFNLPEGSWTDDTSLTLCTLASIRECGTIDPDDIMKHFMQWMYEGKYTPYGFSYDIGFGTQNAIGAYKRGADIHHCGGKEAHNNGNGSLMRILPVCIFCTEKEMSDEEMIHNVHTVSALTHAHARSLTACGLYAFMVRSLIRNEGSLIERLQAGIDEGFAYYEGKHEPEIRTYQRIRNLSEFAKTPETEIESSGYVLHAIEAALWCLITENTLKDSLLKAVNLGEDTDTTAAIAGGLAGLYYGMEAIPENWLEALKKKELFEELLAA